MALTPAERQAAYIARLKGTAPKPAPPRLPVDRRSRPRQWADAVAVLDHLLDRWQEARDRVPDHLADGPYASKLDAVLELREHVEALASADLPLGFGRD